MIKRYWSRAPGKFVNKLTGETAPADFMPRFTGTVREWYETFIEAIFDARNMTIGDRTDVELVTLFVPPVLHTIIQFSMSYSAFEHDVIRSGALDQMTIAVEGSSDLDKLHGVVKYDDGTVDVFEVHVLDWKTIR